MGDIIDFPSGDKPKTDEDLTEEEKKIEEEKYETFLRYIHSIRERIYAKNELDREAAEIYIAAMNKIFPELREAITYAMDTEIDWTKK
tara:strand:+ start:679 stop:942 length:264 start_codon:yes stop_codon:yes gene_type:complete